MNFRIILQFVFLILLYQNASAQHEKSIIIQPGECWYGMGSGLGPRLPIKSDTPDRTFRSLGFDLGGQYLISSHGRYIWCDKSYTLEKKDSMMIVSCNRADIELGENGNTLRDAYMAVSKHFPPSGKTPPEEFFIFPTYNTWIELGYKQNQRGVMDGYQFTCPDMIGGGLISTFENVKEDEFDPTLIIRSCQIHSMMPMMQFSLAPWRILKPEHMAIIRKYSELHVQMGPYIKEQTLKAAQTGEPIVRHMDYEFPGEGFEAVTDQYMLGDRYLVAPVYTSGEERSVRLPRGRWRDEQGKIYKGGKTYTIAVPLDRLPYFERIRK